MPVQPQNEIEDWVGLFIIAVVLLYWLLRVTVLLIAARLERRRGKAESDASSGPAAPSPEALDGDAVGEPAEAPQPSSEAPPVVIEPGVTDIQPEVPPELLERGVPAAQAQDVARLIEATRYILASARQRGNLARQIDMLIHLADLYLLAGDRPRARRSVAEANELLQSTTPADVTKDLEGSQLTGEQFLVLRRARLERVRAYLETL